MSVKPKDSKTPIVPRPQRQRMGREELGRAAAALALAAGAAAGLANTAMNDANVTESCVKTETNPYATSKHDADSYNCVATHAPSSDNQNLAPVTSLRLQPIDDPALTAASLEAKGSAQAVSAGTTSRSSVDSRVDELHVIGVADKVYIYEGPQDDLAARWVVEASPAKARELAFAHVDEVRGWNGFGRVATGLVGVVAGGFGVFQAVGALKLGASRRRQNQDAERWWKVDEAAAQSAALGEAVEATLAKPLPRAEQPDSPRPPDLNDTLLG